MIEIVIKSAANVTIKDNLIHVNSGYDSDNLIPLSTIWFIKEICASKQEKDQIILTILINSQIQIQTDPFNSNDILRHQPMMYEIHEKIVTALHDYHTNTFRINKPKELHNESFKPQENTQP